MDSSLVSDEKLARQSQAGSLAAFEQLVYRYERRIYGFVLQSCRCCTDARELTQDTFVRAYQAIGKFDSRRIFGSWLFTIARRKCIDHFRSAPPGGATAADELEDHDDPAELASRHDERKHLWQLARRLLPTVQFHALWLRYAEDMDVAEIAQVLRKTRTHVKVLLFRARKSLSLELDRARKSARPPNKLSALGNPDRARTAEGEAAPLNRPGPAPA